MSDGDRAWHIYLLECSDGTLYTGVSLDPRHRLEVHNAGHGARYTRTRLPVRLLATRKVGACGDALKLEKRVKGLTAARKRAFFDLP